MAQVQRPRSRYRLDKGGVEADRLQRIVEGGSAEPVPMYERAAMAKDAGAPIEPGTVDTTASVTVTWMPPMGSP